MIIRANLCMPEGTSINEVFGDVMELVKMDNRRLIRALMEDGDHVPNTVTELDLEYVPHRHTTDENGRPVVDVYSLRDMLDRGTFSCADAAAFEAAIMEEKYGVKTRCVSIPRSDRDAHGVFMVGKGVIDPTHNHLNRKSRRFPSKRQNEVEPSSCYIDDRGVVVCDDNPQCAVDQNGRWVCPDVPRLNGRRERISNHQHVSHGQGSATNRYGVLVPTRGSDR